MAKLRTVSLLIGLCLAMSVGFIMVPGNRAKSPSHAGEPRPAPLSSAADEDDDDEGGQAALVRLRALRASAPAATRRVVSSGFGGTWQTVTPAPPDIVLSNPLLLTDGTVIAANNVASDWYKLTPDSNGNYASGTWTQIASLPVFGETPYAPGAHASAVLPDGRVIIMGGEYNGAGNAIWGSFGAIYDPRANSWTAVAPPSGPGWAASGGHGSGIGDAQSAVLANGTFLLGACCGAPPVDALFDATTLSWTSTGAPSWSNSQDEQGYSLLPDGSVLTTDAWAQPNSNGFAPTQAERYVPASGTWVLAGNTPAPLTAATGQVSCNAEVGPAVLRPDGTLVAFGGYNGCSGAGVPDPTAIYASAAGTWSAGPNLPAICGPDGTMICSLPDAPAALLPNGNILFAASGGSGKGVGEEPTSFFEFTRSNTVNPVALPILYADTSVAFYYDFLVLPTGQILVTDDSNIAEIYTPTGSADPGWAPAIAAAPATVVAGQSYSISGWQFNGLSQGAAYGDDAQAATNYPLVQITNSATGHVFYARTFDHSTMSIAPNTASATNFTVPAAIEAGAGTLVVIANGIPSQPVGVTVVAEPDLLVASVLPVSRSVQVGSVATLFATMINTGSDALDNCRIGLAAPAPPGLTLSYQTTNSATNALTGTANTPVTIAGQNGVQSFEIGLQSPTALSVPSLELDFECDGTTPAGFLAGLDTVDLNVSTTPTPDIIAIAVANGGVMTIPQSTNGEGAFAAATIDAGAAGTINLTADTGAAALPLAITVCPTNPSTGACLSPPSGFLQTAYQTNGTQTYSVFATATAPIAFAPGSARVFLRFTDSAGTVRGVTSVAVQTD